MPNSASGVQTDLNPYLKSHFNAKSQIFFSLQISQLNEKINIHYFKYVNISF